MDQLGERMTWNRLPMVFQKRAVAMGGRSLQKTNAESARGFVWKRARGRASGLLRSGRQWWIWKVFFNDYAQLKSMGARAHNEYIYFAPSRVGDYEDQNDLT